MSKPRIALVTAVAARDLDEDMAPLESALREAGADVSIAEWDRPHDWNRFDVALIRSTWDYPSRLEEFLAWAKDVDGKTRLLSPFPVVRWNCDKHYLADLARAGVPAVPTRFIEPGDDSASRIAEFLRETADAEFVAKPAVGGGSQGARRFGRDEHAAAADHARALLDQQRSVLLQPYLDRVDEHGETALMYFDGEFSHAIRKGPLLRRGSELKGELFAKEEIRAREPDAAELSLADRVLKAAPFPAPAYARVDLIRDAQGAPVLLELELIEPSLFFRHAAGSAQRFAATVVRRATGQYTARA